MTARAEYGDLESLFLFYNRLHRDIERRLKPLQLTLTGLQTLMAISRASHPRERTRARLAEALGLTNGSMSVLVGRLIDIGFIEPDPFRLDDKAVALRLTKRGASTMHSGLVGWDDVADVWFQSISPTKRSSLFSTLSALNSLFNQRVVDERMDLFFKSLSKHKTRDRVLTYRRTQGKAGTS